MASLHFVSQFLPQIQSRVITQVESMAPQLWDRIDAIRVKRVQKLKGLLEQAQRDGFFRSDVNPDHWILLLTGTIQSVLIPKILLRTRIPLTSLVGSAKLIYFDGLLTDKGKRYIANKESS